MPSPALDTINQLTDWPGLHENETVGDDQLVAFITYADGTMHDKHSADWNRRWNAECALRELLIAADDGYDQLDDIISSSEADSADVRALLDALMTLYADEYSRDTLSSLAMRHSLCPMHFIDWAICFDDDDPDCAQIRTVFPHSHDT